MKISPWRLLSIYLEGVLYLGGGGETGTRTGSSLYRVYSLKGHTRDPWPLDPSAATTLNACTFVPERIEYDFYIPSYMDVYLEAIASVIPSMPEVTVDSHIQLHQGM